MSILFLLLHQGPALPIGAAPGLSVSSEKKKTKTTILGVMKTQTSSINGFLKSRFLGILNHASWYILYFIKAGHLKDRHHLALKRSLSCYSTTGSLADISPCGSGGSFWYVLNFDFGVMIMDTYDLAFDFRNR